MGNNFKYTDNNFVAPQKKYIALTNENFVDLAEQTIINLAKDKKKLLTTNKIRNILALVSSIFNKAKVLSSDKLNDELIKALQHLKIKCVYEAGRENTVKLFILEANILEHIAEIKGDTTKCLLFCHYMEALVAYHRFYGGKD